eukprot:9726483-Lingulodinium_polyedra.AAC.1
MDSCVDGLSNSFTMRYVLRRRYKRKSSSSSSGASGDSQAGKAAVTTCGSVLLKIMPAMMLPNASPTVPP